MTKLLLGCLFLAGAIGLPHFFRAQPPSSPNTHQQFVAAHADDESSKPPEQGTVKWLRNYDDAITKSASTGKPLFVLFQEIPG